MILKVLQEDTRKWFFYDGIRFLKRKYAAKGELGSEDMDLTSSDGGPEQCILICDVCFRDGSALTLGCGKGYLLNDDGKTIERL